MFSFILSFLIFAHAQNPLSLPKQSGDVLAVKKMSLNDRYPVKSVNDVFKENILLTLAYLEQTNMEHVLNVKTVDKPMHYAFTLHKGQVFAFHDSILPAYNGKVVTTTHAHFNGQEGFQSDGYLMGDGVCHFASLIDYAAKTAGLGVVAPTSHDFANIPEVPKQYGVAIYTTPTAPSASAEQNLYVTNTFSGDVMITFDYKNSELTVSVVKPTS